MDIKVVSKNCAKIILTKNEADKLNIDFENFNKENHETKMFLTYIIAILKDMKIVKSNDEKITVEIYEQENSDLIIYISSSDCDSTDINYESYVLVTDSPEVLCEFVKDARLLYPKKIKDDYLYFFQNSYYLFFKSEIYKENLPSILSTYNIYSEYLTSAQKAKEYGKMLCHTPFNEINNLSSD